MTREELKRSGLLDQYVLGLVNPEQSALVEKMISEDPFLAEEVERLRSDLNTYADSKNITAPASGRAPRTVEEFQDLDHEMILAMMEHNHTLNIWRYVTVGICLLLIGLSGYLFRLKEQYRAELVTEQAVHAQDESAFAKDRAEIREALSEAKIPWDHLSTVETTVALGAIRVHAVADRGLALIDLSELLPPAEGIAYYIISQEAGQAIVTAAEQRSLFPVELDDVDSTIRVYRAPEAHGENEGWLPEQLIAEIDLAAYDRSQDEL